MLQLLALCRSCGSSTLFHYFNPVHGHQFLPLVPDLDNIMECMLLVLFVLFFGNISLCNLFSKLLHSLIMADSLFSTVYLCFLEFPSVCIR